MAVSTTITDSRGYPHEIDPFRTWSDSIFAEHSLRRLIRAGTVRHVLYLDHLEENGSGLFTKACELDLEGIVAKWKAGR